MKKNIVFYIFSAFLASASCNIIKPMNKAIRGRERGYVQINNQLLFYAEELGGYINSKKVVPQKFFNDMAQLHANYHKNFATNFQALSFYNIVLQQARAHNQLAHKNNPAVVQP